jgi:hypothetical protein
MIDRIGRAAAPAAELDHRDADRAGIDLTHHARR